MLGATLEEGEEKGSGVFLLTGAASWGNIRLCYDVLAKRPVELCITRLTARLAG